MRLEDRLEVSIRNHAKPWSVFSQFLNDLLFALRALRRSPRFTFAAVATIALGIGATTAIFSIINGVILRPLPYTNPDRIMWVWGKFSQGERAAVSPPDFLDYRTESKTFQHFAAMHIMHQWINSTVNMIGDGDPVRLNGAYVTSGFFEAFGIGTHLGRTFQVSDEKASSQTMILSFDAWMKEFGGDPEIVGKQVRLSDNTYTVIGVMKDGFHYPLETEIWFPLEFGTRVDSSTMVDSMPDMTNRRFHFLRPIGRLKKGIGIDQAQAELDTIAIQLERTYPESNKTWRTGLESLHQQLVGDIRKPLFIIFGAVCCLLLIACANVANLLLARTTTRRRELSIRVALGAQQSHIFRQLFTESLLLTIPAGIAGLILAIWSVNAFKIAAPNFVPRLNEVSVDSGTLLFTAAGSLLTALLVSLAPLLNVFSGISTELLGERTSTGTGGNSRKLRSSLAVIQFALSLILIAGAALLLKSFWHLTKVDPGFQAQNVSMVRITLDEVRYPTAESTINYIEASLEKIRNLPGVEMAAAGNGLPLIAAGGDRFFTIEGRPAPVSDANKPNAQFRAITRDYFKTLSIPILRGRSFSAQDHEKSAGVVIINDALAKQYFKGEDPIGQYLSIDGVEALRVQIIGIVRGSRQDLDQPPMPEMYLLHQQSPIGFFIIAVRTKPGLVPQIQAIRAVLREIDQNLPLRDFRSMEEIVTEAYARNRLNAILLGGAALLALLLAAIGIYGVLSFSVEQRRHEIGVRMAVGAGKNDILKMILRSGISLAFTGLILGMIGTVLLTRWMRSLLYEVSPLDPFSLIVGSIVLLVAAVMACWLPARRATQLDPLRTLRYE